MDLELISSLSQKDKELLGLEMIEAGKFLSQEEISQKCIRKSELDKLSVQERQDNKKSIIGDDASVAVVLGYGSKVVSWSANDSYVGISLDSSTTFVVQRFSQFTKPNGGLALKRDTVDMDSYKDTTVEGYDENLFTELHTPFYLDQNILKEDTKRDVLEEETHMENTNTNGFSAEGFGSGEFDNGGFGTEGFGSEGFGAEGIDSFTNMGTETGVSESVEDGNIAYLQNAVRAVAYLSPKDSQSTISTKKEVVKELYNGKQIPVLSEEGKADAMALEYIKYKKAQIVDPKNPAVAKPMVDDNNGGKKSYTLPAAYKVYRERLITKYTNPKVGSVILKVTQGGKRALTEYIRNSDALDGGIDYASIDAENPALDAIAYDATMIKNYMSLVGGVIYEEGDLDKVAALYLKEAKGKPALAISVPYGSKRKGILTENNYFPEKIVKSAPLSAKATDDELAALQVAGDIYAELLGDKLANLTEDTKDLVLFNKNTGKYTFPALGNRDELSAFAERLNAGTWFDKDAKVAEPRLSLVYYKEKKDGGFTKKRDAWVSVPANAKKFTVEESILVEGHPLHDRFLPVRQVLPGFFEYENLRSLKSSKGKGGDTGSVSKREESAKEARNAKLSDARKSAEKFRFNSSKISDLIAGGKTEINDPAAGKITSKALEVQKSRLAKAFSLK